MRNTSHSLKSNLISGLNIGISIL